MLCCVFACNGKYLVTGGKDKLVRVYDVKSGKLTHILQGHTASICSMSSHNGFVSTGGDHGCGSVIIWDTKTWTIKNKITAHTAAVTCILDLNDGRNLVTGSYDKKINILDYRRSEIILNLS